MIDWSVLKKGREGRISLSTRGLKLIKSNKEYAKSLINENCSVLDIGCNDGSFLKSLNVKRKVGMDIDKKIKPKGIEFHNKLSTIKGKFDLITMFDVIEHLDENEIKKYIEFCKKHLKKGGHLLISTLNISCPLNTMIFWYDLTHKRPIPYMDFKTYLKTYFKNVDVYKYDRVAWFRIPFCILGGDIYLNILFDCY